MPIRLKDSTELLTLGEVVEVLRETGGPDVPIHRVKHAIARCGIEPAGRVGILRVWRADSIPAIRAAVLRIRRGGKGGDAKQVPEGPTAVVGIQ